MTTDDRLLRLRAGDLELDIAPAHGAGYVRFAAGGVDLFRPGVHAVDNPRAGGCFALVPFSNRVRDATFDFRGETHRLEPNFPPEPHAIHGHGWCTAWVVEARGPDHAHLGFTHGRPEELFCYRARQEITLAADGLRVALHLENTGSRAMPAGLGLHPYMSRRPGTLLTTEVAGHWIADASNIPIRREAIGPDLDMRGGKPVAEIEIDGCFFGWSRHARIEWPDPGLSLTIDADPLFGHVVIYVPAGTDFFCVEPVSHVNDGFNRLAMGETDTGVQVLEPGQTLAGEVRFAVIR